jgi:integrase
MDTHFSFTKPKLDSLPCPKQGDRITYHDTHKNAYGLQIRVTNTSKVFFIQKRVNGKPERITIGRFPDISIENARNEAANLSAQIAQGINPNENTRSLKTETTLQELFDNFIANRRNKRGAFLSEKTKRSYNYDFNAYLGKWKNRQLSQFKDTDFGKLHAEIGKTHQTTANRIIAMSSSLFGYAEELKLFKGKNPAKGIKKFPENKRERFLQSDELPAFFKSLSEETNTTLRDYFLISLLTGARRSNVQAMRWQDINFTRAEWRLDTTKNGTGQTVTLGNEALEVLKERQGCDPVFVFPGVGKSGHLEEPKKAWTRLLERAGIDNLRIHDLRRTLGSWQAKTGASMVIIGKSLNHQSHQTTAIYARLNLDPVRESVDRATDAMLVAGRLKAGADIVPIKSGHKKDIIRLT